MHVRIPLAALALALLAAPAADARSFGVVDRNNDGVIEYTEARTALKNMAEVHFNKCDTNRDGVVDESEYGCLSGIYDSLYRRPN